MGIALGPIVAVGSPWRLGVIADTQWTVADDGYGPHSVPAGIIQQIDKEFIRHSVKLVVAVGDTIDGSSKASIDTRASMPRTCTMRALGSIRFAEITRPTGPVRQLKYRESFRKHWMA